MQAWSAGCGGVDEEGDGETEEAEELARKGRDTAVVVAPVDDMNAIRAKLRKWLHRPVERGTHDQGT